MTDDGVEAQSAPTWVRALGAVFGGLTLLYLMAITVFALLRPLPAGAAFPLVLALAVGLALSTSFIGGSAAVEGKLPLPFARDHPLAITAVGGIAVFVLTMTLAPGVYRRVSETERLPPLLNESLPSGMTVRSAARHFASTEGFTEIFDESCQDTVLAARVRPGLMSAANAARLIELLPARLETPQPNLKINVNVLQERGMYEIHCET